MMRLFFRVITVVVLLGAASFFQTTLGQAPAAAALTCWPSATPGSYPALKRAVGNARIVMLGEQTHFDGATLAMKVDLVRYLHDSLGFNVLAFEADMYGLDKAEQQRKKARPALEVLQAALYNKRVWSGTAEFAPLATYLDQQPTLRLAGFDCELRSEYTEESALPELQRFLSQDRRARWVKEDFTVAEEVVGELLNGGDFRWLLRSPTDSVKLQRWFNKTQTSLRALSQRHDSLRLRAAFWQQWLASTAGQLTVGKANARGNTRLNNTYRDELMAANLLALAQRAGTQKIIVWAASSHLANRAELLDLDDATTQSYVEQMRRQQPEADDSVSLRTMMSGFVPMGRQLKARLGAQVYALGFVAYQGQFGSLTEPRSLQPVPTPPAGSLEAAFLARNCPAGLVDLRSSPGGTFYASPLGYLPIKAPWAQLFDGLIFIRDMRPVSPLTAAAAATPGGAAGSKLAGHVRDAKTGAPLSFASISFRGAAIGTVSNLQGEFSLFVPAGLEHDTLQISSLGYATARQPLRQVRPGLPLRVALTPQTRLLDEVVIAAPISPETILERVRQHLPDNYIQAPHSMELFYRHIEQFRDSITLQEDIALDFYDQEGYRRGSWEHASKEKFLQIRQLKRASNRNKAANNSLPWLMWSADPILTTRNPLSAGPGAHYSLTLQGETQYGNRSVYQIGFECTKPNAFSTPYAYPSPSVYRGTIYVDTRSYAVVRYEALMQREPLEITRKKVYHRHGFDQPVRYQDSAHDVYQYEEYNGRYFLKYSSRATTLAYSTLSGQAVGQRQENSQLLATHVETTHPKVLQSSMVELDFNVPYRPEFWNTYQVILPTAAPRN